MLIRSSVIHANCRVRLTADDFAFVIGALSKSEKDRVSLVNLLTDEETRDAILDHRGPLRDDIELAGAIADLAAAALLRAVPEGAARHVGKEPPRPRTTWPSLLNGFLRTTRLECPRRDQPAQLRYISDMLDALARAGTREAFLIRDAHRELRALRQRRLCGQRRAARCEQKGAPEHQILRGDGKDELPRRRGIPRGEEIPAAGHLRGIVRRVPRGAARAERPGAAALLHMDSPALPIITA